MDVMVRGNNIKITEHLQEYTEKKLSRLDRYLPNIAEVRVDLSRQKARSTGQMTVAQITLRHSRGAILRAEEKIIGDDRNSTEAAINTAVDKLYRQIERFKGKRRSKRRNGGERFIATPEELTQAEEIPIEEYDEYEEIEEAIEEYEDPILRRKEVDMMPMTEHEAIDQMELLGHSFFMFFNTVTGSVNVLYRRDIGGYGVLVPKM